jgi:hypothetical protein
MARMKTGRLTPKTTDPQGNRIADPEVYGKKIEEGTVGSWPEARKIYQKEKDKSLKNTVYHPAVKKYLEGETNQLSDTEFEEPVINYSVDGDTGRRHADFYSGFKKGGKGYKAADARSRSIEGKFYEAPKEGQIQHYNSAETIAEIKKSGYGSRGSFTDLDQYRKKPVTPTAPVKAGAPPTPTKPEDLTLPGKMDIRKAGPIKGNTKLAKGKPTKVVERADFVNPAKNVKRKDSVDMNPLAGGAYSKGSGKRYAKQVIASIGKTGENNRGYNKEEKRFKAYAGTTATGDSFRDMNPGEIKAYREEAKSARAEYRKQPASDLKSMGKAAMTSEIRQSRKAEKFAKAAYKPGGVKFFNDKRYGGNIERDYQESTQNAANRNTMDAKLKAIGEKTKKYEADKAASTIGGFQYNSPIR